MRSHIQVLSLVLLVINSNRAAAQSYPECCDVNLMDATRQVAIETERILELGTFQALRVRLCTSDPVTIQIWTRITATEYQFKWQTQITATDQQTREIPYTLINLQNNPVTLTAADRLAFYSPSNSSSKVAVPYQPDAINGALRYSQLRYTGSQFVSGQQINVDSLSWPRTFLSFIAFCDTVANCGVTTTPASTVRPTSSSGGTTGICCPPPAMGTISCDPGGVIGDNLNDQQDQIKALEDDINRLLFILNNLLNSTVITGICPDGFISGVYGVGSCYVIHKDEKVQLAQAAIRCRDNYKAELLRLESQLEDEFIKNVILNRTNPVAVESYWTAGMYNIPLRNWYWYSDNTRTKAPYNYRNWRNGMEPAATSIYDVCSVYVLDTPNTKSYWEKNECTASNYYICEIPKQCL